MIVPEYTVGDWTAVVRPGFVALLGPQVPDSTARAVWDATDRGVLGVLAVLSHDGLGSLPPFALVAANRGRVHVALRGDVEVVVGADVLASGEVSTWTERVVEGVESVSVRVAGTVAGGVELPLTEGVVRAVAVRVALANAEAEAPAEPEAEASSRRGVGEVRVAEPEPEPAQPEPETPVVAEAAAPDEGAAQEPAVEPEPAGPTAPAADEVEPPVAEAVVPEPVALVPLDEGDQDGPDDVADVVAAAEAFLVAAPVPSPPVDVEGASAEDHDGMTILSSDLVAIRDQLPAWAADDAPAPFRAPAPVVTPARLVLSTGLVVDLDRTVLVGRAPQVSRVANRELPRLVTVPSPQQDISRTHAEVRTEGELVLVTDLDSTNGVHVTRPGEGARRLHPGEPTVVEPGEVVDLGDDVTFTVERGA